MLPMFELKEDEEDEVQGEYLTELENSYIEINKDSEKLSSNSEVASEKTP